MNDIDKSTELDTVPCEVCLKEIPRSHAKTSEVDDYVAYFCGIDCYDVWQKENKEKE
ncbi:MAG: DUF3330 domain-containing protein [Gammaproteobacteria bacterium]|nr:DUF3330 domain-containing protein [Gammaproteobacteria bacterium]